ncbi:hypothetical protein GAYE_SCF51G6093 [Galdieria yellowstonensis]|uniref:Uncharacterized protein n=1 Tax=Galdieria yellowstonensis TaxID=3028027 RepID=A0AAV9ILJ5_9RHOD|nr:hypothetical protein GAYE_SCF51G6093 [Galdieria yellowstonensis]
MIPLVPARDDESNQLWLIPDPLKELPGPRFFTVADSGWLKYHLESPPLIPKLKEDISLHPDILELVREAQWKSVVQNVQLLLEKKKASFDFSLDNNSCVDLVLRLGDPQQQEQPLAKDDEIANVCKEKNIYYRHLSKKLDVLEQLTSHNNGWMMGCFRSYGTCQLLAEIEKANHLETD